jgi:hypothetical protein
MMEVRRVALSRFGENAIRTNTPLAQLEDVLVPLYLHHRYQAEAAASVLGGVNYIYAMRGDGREAMRPATAAEQLGALRALMATLSPSALALPASVLAKIPPRPPGFGRTRELFPRYTGSTFDAITPAVVASDVVVSALLTSDRAARLVEQKMLDQSLPGLDEVIEALFGATFGATPASPYQAELKRAVERVVIERLMSLAEGASMPQVRAIASLALQRQAAELSRLAGSPAAASNDPGVAHGSLLTADIRRFLERPAGAASRMSIPGAPPGAPIGEPAMDWLSRLEPPCTWWGAADTQWR